MRFALRYPARSHLAIPSEPYATPEFCGMRLSLLRLLTRELREGKNKPVILSFLYVEPRHNLLRRKVNGKTFIERAAGDCLEDFTSVQQAHYMLTPHRRTIRKFFEQVIIPVHFELARADWGTARIVPPFRNSAKTRRKRT